MTRVRASGAAADQWLQGSGLGTRETWHDQVAASQAGPGMGMGDGRAPWGLPCAGHGARWETKTGYDCYEASTHYVGGCPPRRQVGSPRAPS